MSDGFDNEVGVGEVWVEEALEEREHHIHWNDALRQAINDAERKGRIPDEGKWFRISYFAHARRSSPGWVDGYRVEVGP